MDRLRLTPPNPVHHAVELRVRATDLNYGRHLGHMELIGLVHEARMRLFRDLGVEEFDVDGLGLVVTELQATYLEEAFGGQTLRVETGLVETGRSVVHFRSALSDHTSKSLVAVVDVGGVFVDHWTGKIRTIPPAIGALIGGRS